METLKSVIAVMRPRQWMGSVDLKDTYFQIGVVLAHHQYLRFSLLWIVLPVQGPARQSVLGPASLHQDSSPICGLVQVDRGTAVPVPR